MPRYIPSSIGRSSSRSFEGRGWYVAGLVLSVAFAVVCASLVFSGISGALGSAAERARTGSTLSVDIGWTIIMAPLTVWCVFLVAHYEHLLRRNQPTALSWAEANGARQESPRLSTGFFAMRNRAFRYSPIAITVRFLALVVITALLSVASFNRHTGAVRSGWVQQHGIARIATVDYFQNVYHRNTHGGGYYTALIGASFAPPIQGVTRTLAHYPIQAHLSDGEMIKVLVDPTDPSYAEIPGAPATNGWVWILDLALAVASLAASFVAGRAAIRVLLHVRKFKKASATTLQ